MEDWTVTNIKLYAAIRKPNLLVCFEADNLKTEPTRPIAS